MYDVPCRAKAKLKVDEVVNDNEEQAAEAEPGELDGTVS